MSGIVVCGAGVCGLATAMLLAKDGHEVTVLERDLAPPPDGADAQWEEWERKGVNQFRLPHFLMPGFRAVMDVELPVVVEELLAGGAHRFNPLGQFAESMDPEGEHIVVTARRPVVEAAMARAAARTPGVVVRRGVAVAGLMVEGDQVVGLRTEGGEEVRADLVVDAGGRRSPMARWLVEAGRPAPTLEEEDSGLVYYGRYVRLPDGRSSDQPGMALYGSIALLVLPADHGTVGIGIIASSKDAAVRALRHEGPWRAVLAALPGGEELAGCEPVSPLVAMASIEDRWRRFVVDGQPVATGVVSVADAWAATNPTLGRGITLGAKHAVALRDVVREVGTDDADALVRRFDAVTQEWFTPWYRATVWHDRHRLDDLDDAIAGTERPLDPRWEAYRRFEAVTNLDPDLARRAFGGMHLRETPLELIEDPVVLARLDELGAKVAPPTGLTRRELLDLIAAADAA
jgi:2-polyprenyl-6-methoxyphenol hydroxylase-like FAD-dependent oxidoreductase